MRRFSISVYGLGSGEALYQAAPGNVTFRHAARALSPSDGSAPLSDEIRASSASSHSIRSSGPACRTFSFMSGCHLVVGVSAVAQTRLRRPSRVKSISAAYSEFPTALGR